MTGQALTAVVSYQWDDSAAAELLHEELGLRGLTVLHDRCSFLSGSRIGANMAEAVSSCDGFIAYLTPSSLYEAKPLDAPRPALDDEFKPAMDRAARARSNTNGLARPVVIPLTHGLGDPRTEAPERVRRASGKDISTLWTPIVLDQTTPMITQSEAATTARSLLTALLPADSADADPIELALVTRGEGQGPRFLTVDATNLLGGPVSRPGEPDNWRRLLAGLRDLELALAVWAPRRRIRILAKAHITGALTLGRVFNQAAGWRPVVEGRLGTAQPSDARTQRHLRASLDRGAVQSDLSVEIDVLGVGVSDLASHVLANLPQPVPNRLCIWRDDRGDLTPEDVADMASAASFNVREAVFDLRPERIHLFCASPVEFAILLGRCLTSLHADIYLYERDGNKYTPSLVIPANTP